MVGLLICVIVLAGALAMFFVETIALRRINMRIGNEKDVLQRQLNAERETCNYLRDALRKQDAMLMAAGGSTAPSVWERIIKERS